MYFVKLCQLNLRVENVVNVNRLFFHDFIYKSMQNCSLNLQKESAPRKITVKRCQFAKSKL